MRLGVSPTAASTPTGVFNQRFEALFPQAGALGCAVCFTPQPFLLVYLWVNVGTRGLLAVALPARSFHNLSPVQVRQPLHCRDPLRPGCPSSLPLLLVWMNVSSLSPWLSDFHTVGFFCQFWLFLFLNCCFPFGSVRRHSVSTYISILAGSLNIIIL